MRRRLAQDASPSLHSRKKQGEGENTSQHGIEGENTMREQPYMGMTGFGKWRKLMGRSSGMWLMHYNPRTGNIMVEKNE